MDSETKRKQAEAVRKHLSRRLAPIAFRRTKSTFWTRADSIIVQFVHLHLLTFASAFRVHFGLRVLNDTFPAPALNGPMSADGWAQADRKYQFHFSRTHDSVVVCADELASYVAEAGLPWFERFASPEGALTPNGPLTEDSQARLRLALGGEPDAAAVAASRAMLGISS